MTNSSPTGRCIMAIRHTSNIADYQFRCRRGCQDGGRPAWPRRCLDDAAGLRPRPPATRPGRGRGPRWASLQTATSRLGHAHMTKVTAGPDRNPADGHGRPAAGALATVRHGRRRSKLGRGTLPRTLPPTLPELAPATSGTQAHAVIEAGRALFSANRQGAWQGRRQRATRRVERGCALRSSIPDWGLPLWG